VIDGGATGAALSPDDARATASQRPQISPEASGSRARAATASKGFTYNREMDRTFLLVGALAGFIGVAFGAFGAHALRGRLSPEMLAVFETGVRYQMYHAFAVLIVALAAARFDGWLVRAAGWSFTLGIVLFSGSLYALALTGVTKFGMITPVGGLAFLVGWALLIVLALV